MDALALMLTKVGVRSHSKILVVEDGVGILTAAVAERLGGAAEQCVQSAPASHSRHSHSHSGYGRIFHVFSGAQPKLELLRRLSSSAQADAADGTPALESTVACIPITGVAELAAQQVSAPCFSALPQSATLTRWCRPPVLAMQTTQTQWMTTLVGRFCLLPTKRVAGCVEGATGRQPLPTWPGAVS